METEKLLQQGYRYAYSLTHNPAFAEDLLHDAWVSMLNISAPQTAPYLFKSIRNKHLNHRKRSNIIPFVSLEEVLTEDDLLSDESDFSHLLANQQLLERGLARLNPLEREVIYLYYYEEYTTTEIATLIAHSKGTVCSLIYRSRLKLKAFLEVDSLQEAL